MQEPNQNLSLSLFLSEAFNSPQKDKGRFDAMRYKQNNSQRKHSSSKWSFVAFRPWLQQDCLHSHPRGWIKSDPRSGCDVYRLAVLPKKSVVRPFHDDENVSKNAKPQHNATDQPHSLVLPLASASLPIATTPSSKSTVLSSSFFRYRKRPRAKSWVVVSGLHQQPHPPFE